MTNEEKRRLVEKNSVLTKKDQIALLQLNKSTYYYKPVEVSEYDQYLLNRIDEIYTKRPFYGYRPITDELNTTGDDVNHKKVLRLMNLLGISAVVPKKNLSKFNEVDQKYPYLLKDLEITKPNQVWCSDITYIRMRHGFLYLIAEMDWYSRYVISWKLTNTMHKSGCVSVLQEALNQGRPQISNTDQGSQYTSQEYTDLLKIYSVKISMDGRGRAFDNIFIERLWRTVKYEEVYLYDYADGNEARDRLEKYFLFYNHQWRHSSLEKRTFADVYFNY